MDGVQVQRLVIGLDYQIDEFVHGTIYKNNDLCNKQETTTGLCHKISKVPGHERRSTGQDLAKKKEELARRRE